jgi:hypothetical protein
MNIASCSKKSVMYRSAGLLLMASAAYAEKAPTKYTYTASNLSVHFRNSVGKHNSLQFQQCGALEVAANTTNTNSLSNGEDEADAFGIAFVQESDTCSVNVNSSNTGTSLLYVNVGSVDIQFLQGMIPIGSIGESLGLQSAGGSAPPYTLTDTFVTDISSGISIPNGNHTAGEKFDVSTPVSVTTDGGATETDTFTGKLVLGELHPLRDAWGNIIGTRFIAMHISGKLTASDGGKYDIDENIGQTDMEGIKPNQVTLNFTFTEF